MHCRECDATIKVSFVHCQYHISSRRECVLSAQPRTKHETALLSDLIGSIYDAAVDPALWPNALDQTARFARGAAAALFWKDVSNKSGNLVLTVGLEPNLIKPYFEKYVTLDSVSTSQMLAIEQPVASGEVIPYDEFLQIPLHWEWTQPQHLTDCVTAVVQKTSTSAAMLAIFRHKRDGVADDDMRRRMRLIVPHIRRAALIGKAIDLKRAEAETLVDTLDGISAGMILVEATGRIAHVNAAGRALLDSGCVLRSRSGRLIAIDRDIDQRLADIFATAGNGNAAIGVKATVLPLVTRSGENYVAHVLPLSSGARRRAARAYAAVAALFVHKAAINSASVPGAVAKAYKLTPSELRVLLAIIEVGGVPEVAHVLGVGTETVKTHLRHIYQKTGASRQVDLAKIVARFWNPLLAS
jgi:DNA-binding CsgD family transcriptional regulator